MLNNPNEWHNIEEEIESNVNESITEDGAEKPQNPVKINIKYVKIGLLVLAVVFIAFLAVGKKIQSNKAEVALNSSDPSQMTEYFYDKASGGASSEPTAVVDVNLADDGTAVQSPQSQVGNIPPINGAVVGADMAMDAKGNKAIAKTLANRETVIVSVGNEGRENPFMPYREKKISIPGAGYSGSNSPSFDIIEPPTSVLPDPKAVQLLETTISGIMYDYKNPSAIVNINGQDQLVRKYDKLNGFTILDITREKVVMKSGTNIYRASVGQSITTEDVNVNDIPNLRHKFGGSYTPVSRKSIEIQPN